MIKLLLVCLFATLLAACPLSNNNSLLNASSDYHSYTWTLSSRKSLWPVMADHFKLEQHANEPLVKKAIHFYLRHPETLQRLTNNASPYIFYIYEETQRRHMPAELALLPMVESNYNPFLYSRTGATGLWQMMPGTASGFGLTINWWYDGRRDIVASTKAALDYLSYLHEFFGSWPLAIAAYDSGEGTVQQAVRFNKRAHKSTDFWALPLPYETKNYLPKLLALSIIISHPQKYHAQLAKVWNRPTFATVDMDKQIEISTVARLAKTSVDKIRQLNPGFRRWATTPAGLYTLLLPVNKVDAFKSGLSNHDKVKITWLHHNVTRGESLALLAHKYHTRVSVLRKVNGLKNDTLHIGQNILVPLSDHGTFTKKVITLKGTIAEDRLPGPHRVQYEVHSHDTLWSIAARYNVTPRQLRYWNKLPYHGGLKPKTKLVIWQPHYKHISYYYNYHVRRGDTLSIIARRFGTSEKSILRSNRIENNVVRIGQLLRIPKPDLRGHYHTSMKNQLVFHRIRPRESIDSIARYYRVSASDLRHWNHLHWGSQLRVGGVLKVFISK